LSRRNLAVDDAPVAPLDPEGAAFDLELPQARQIVAVAAQCLQQLQTAAREEQALVVAPLREALRAAADSVRRHPDAVPWAARLREDDPRYPATDGLKTAIAMLLFARQLGLSLDEMESAALVGGLADIGKVRVPRSLLEKPGMLTAEEFAQVRLHVALGLEMLAPTELPAEVISGIAQHHERLDGSGYPERLSDESIGLFGRMAAIADGYTAMVTARSYAFAMSPQDALRNLNQWTGGAYHAPLVAAFALAVGAFPVGALIELSNGEIAVVVTRPAQRRLEPRVLVLRQATGTVVTKPFVRALDVRLAGGAEPPPRIVRSLAAGELGLRVFESSAALRPKVEVSGAAERRVP
jgi:hypothetical protein